jgi:hypothetical protein
MDPYHHLALRIAFHQLILPVNRGGQNLQSPTISQGGIFDVFSTNFSVL